MRVGSHAGLATPHRARLPQLARDGLEIVGDDEYAPQLEPPRLQHPRGDMGVGVGHLALQKLVANDEHRHVARRQRAFIRLPRLRRWCRRWRRAGAPPRALKRTVHEFPRGTVAAVGSQQGGVAPRRCNLPDAVEAA